MFTLLIAFSSWNQLRTYFELRFSYINYVSHKTGSSKRVTFNIKMDTSMELEGEESKDGDYNGKQVKTIKSNFIAHQMKFVY